jgi:hypothetical protein
VKQSGSETCSASESGWGGVFGVRVTVVVPELKTKTSGRTFFRWLRPPAAWRTELPGSGWEMFALC